MGGNSERTGLEKNILRTDVIAYLSEELKGKFVAFEGLNLPNHWILQMGSLIIRLHYLSLAITRLHGEIKAQNVQLTIHTVIPIKHLSAYCYWANLFPTLMQNEIADLTKDAKLQRVFESSGRKLPECYTDPLTNWDLVEIDQLTFEEMISIKIMTRQAFKRV